MKYFRAGFFVLDKQQIFKQLVASKKITIEMGSRSIAFIDANYQDLLENKENIKEISLIENSYLLKDSEKSLSNISVKILKERKQKSFLKKVELKNTVMPNPDDVSASFSKILKDGKKGVKPLCNSIQKMKDATKKQDISEIKSNLNKFCDPLLTKEAVVILRRYKDIQQDTFSSIFNSSNNKNDNSRDSFPECECHSSLLLKEAVVVLERYEGVQETITQPGNDTNAVLTDHGKAKKVPNKSGKGTKRKKEDKGKAEDEGGSNSAKSKKQKDSNVSKSSKKEKIPDVSAIDFNNDSKSPSDNPWNFKISSWNINGIRAWLEKNGISYLHHEKPDIMCVQETKCSDEKLPAEMKDVEGYHSYWLAGDKKGYSGIGLLTKEKPIKVEYGIGISEHDNEGRVITAEYEKFYLVNTYVPNAGRGLVRLDYRMTWDKDLRNYLKKLDAVKPVILTGDLNVAHEEIDLANPKTNKKNAGFTKEEREGFTALLTEGFIDSFRNLYPNVTGAYTFWTYMMNARAKNVGWRLDYFVISQRFTENLCDNVIRKDVFGSDHCPITLFLSL